MGPMAGMAAPGEGLNPMQATMRSGAGMLGPLGGGPPGTRQGIGTRQGTAARLAGGGVGSHTEVKIENRPMTSAMNGLSGLKTGSLGPKRQVYDKTYYLLQLTKRCKELQEEVEKMNKESDASREDNKLYQQLEKRYDTLVRTVRSLEGDLADYNLATDKQRTDTRPEEVHHMFMIMKQQNDAQRQEVDQIFLEKKSHEEEIQGMQEEIMGLARAAEERLNELHPDQHREYEMLREESVRLNQELSDGRDDLDQVSQRLNTLEGHLRSDVLRMRSQMLLETRKEVAERLSALEAEARQCSLTIPEQRDLLLAKVKSDNADIVAAEKSNSDMKLQKERLRAAIQEVATDASEKDVASDQQKYEILFSKDQEMSQFIDSYDRLFGEEEAKLAEKQVNVTRLLENISKTAELEKNVTPENHMKDIEDELDFKNKQLQNSETTQNRLEAELMKRGGELEKIESLDTKITQELQQVEAKMEQYQQEMASNLDIPELQEGARARTQLLEARREHLEARSAALRQQVRFLGLRLESRKQQLADDAVAAGLEGQEQKIRQFGQTLHALRSYIGQKAAESDYRKELDFCMDTANQLNKILMERPRMQMA
jgi:intraflagellar transport protein 74